MGAPDPWGRQLDGMGQGSSSTSKICVLSPSLNRDISDVDFTFVQVGIKNGTLDMAGNCGNMLSMVGPIAWDDGLCRARDSQANRNSRSGVETATVRILNTNTNKVVHSTFRISGKDAMYTPEGRFHLKGVPGSHHSRIDLSFIQPGGALTGRALPTGNAVDTLRLPDGSTIEASLVDVSNPGVFVRVTDIGLPDPTSLNPVAVEADAALMDRLEQIRQADASMMGLDPKTESVPKIVLVFPPHMTQLTSPVDIRCLALSMGQAHKTVPLTLALCLGAATRLPGTIPNQLVLTKVDERDDIVIEHPGGKLDVRARIENGEVLSADLWRTGRVLMAGDVFY
jgi:2-methylaconitate cis-trans-isomerase PrpF